MQPAVVTQILFTFVPAPDWREEQAPRNVSSRLVIIQCNSKEFFLLSTLFFILIMVVYLLCFVILNSGYSVCVCSTRKIATVAIPTLTS